MRNLEISNSNLLEDYQDEVSNRTIGENKSNMDADTAAQLGTAGANLAAMLAANKAAKDTAYANTGCQPLTAAQKTADLFNGSKNRTAYQRCLAVAQQKAADDLAREQIRLAIASGSNGSSVLAAQTKSTKKFLGMPQTTGIVVTVLGSIALLVGGIVAIKKFS